MTITTDSLQEIARNVTKTSELVAGSMPRVGELMNSDLKTQVLPRVINLVNSFSEPLEDAIKEVQNFMGQQNITVLNNTLHELMDAAIKIEAHCERLSKVVDSKLPTTEQIYLNSPFPTLNSILFLMLVVVLAVIVCHSLSLLSEIASDAQANQRRANVNNNGMVRNNNPRNAATGWYSQFTPRLNGDAGGYILVAGVTSIVAAASVIAMGL